MFPCNSQTRGLALDLSLRIILTSANFTIQLVWNRTSVSGLVYVYRTWRQPGIPTIGKAGEHRVIIKRGDFLTVERKSLWLSERLPAAGRVG